LHNEELHKLYFTPDIVRMIKLRKIRWEGHVTRAEENKNANNFCRITLRKITGKT
jgi:hypothetical protein